MGNISTNGTISATNIFANGNQVLHAGNWSSYCAAASHSHNYLPLSGGSLSGRLKISYIPTSAIMSDQNIYLEGSWARDGNITGAPGIGFYEDGCGWGNLKCNWNVFKFMAHDLSAYLPVKCSQLQLEANGVTCQIGSLNDSFVHFISNNGCAFYFNHTIQVAGALCLYNANSNGCGSTFPSNPVTGQIFFKF